jgi:hypothetical protein
MAHPNENHNGEGHAERAESPHQTVRASRTILPPSQHNPDDVSVPYANELLLLSFEGRHKEFEVPKDDLVTLIRAKASRLLRLVKSIIKP